MALRVNGQVVPDVVKETTSSGPNSSYCYPYPQLPPAHPCPTCGRCPTCGAYGPHQQPWSQPYITWGSYSPLTSENPSNRRIGEVTTL